MTRALSGLLGLRAADLRALAERVRGEPGTWTPLRGRIVAVLPFGPSALPPAAWLAAAQRLGAGVLRLDDVTSGATPPPLSVAVEAARHADVLVTSHPALGFARAASELAGVPVVNAGEGDGEDPASGLSLLAAALAAHTQTGLSADRRSAPARDRIHVAVCGDLRGSRAARALLAALAALDATVLLVPARGRDLPEDALQRLARRTGRRPLRFEARTMRSLLDMVDTVLLAPEEAPQLPLFQEVGVPPGESERRARREVEDTDVLLVAPTDGAPERLVAAPFRGRGRAVPEGVVHRTHPGALAALLEFAAAAGAEPGRAEAELFRDAALRYRSPYGLRCRNGACIAAREPAHVLPDFLLLTRSPADLECLHCGTRTRARHVGSSEALRHHPVGSADAAKVLDANLVLFRTPAEALEAGFSPSRRGHGRPA